MKRPSLPLLSGLAALGPIGAQQFVSTVMPQVPGISRQACVLDLDGDGADDVVTRSFDGRSLAVFANNGHAVFTRAPDIASATTSVLQNGQTVAGDVDGDGDLDLVLSRSTVNGVVLVLLRNQQGTLVEDPAPLPVATTTMFYGALLLDADGDGDRDLVTHTNSATLLLRNDGTGAFTLANGALPPVTMPRTLLAGDFDRDGRTDLAVGTLSGLRLWMARGTALTDESASRLPAGTPQVVGITALDHDGDADLDLVVSNSSLNPAFLLLDNDGTGVFTDRSSRLPVGLPSSPIATLALDIDGDGLRDLILGQQLVRSAGGGAFVRIGSLTESPVQACDLDGDRFDDLVQFSGIARNLGGQGFRPLVHCPALLAGDLDRDGSSELLDMRYVWRTDGSVVERRQTLAAALTLGSAAVGDLDGDGDLDLANRGSGLGLWTNDGTGALSLAFTVPIAATQRGLALLDYDGDGDLDAAMGGFGWPLGAPPGLHENLGGLNFGDVSATALPPGLPLAFRTVVAGDADADGDADLLFGVDPSTTGLPMATLLLNNGNGTFGNAGAAFDPPTGAGPAMFAQFDADPELEIVVAANPTLFLFDRSGGIWRDVTAARIPASVTPIVGVVPVDFDGDGDVDLVAAGGPGFLLQNDGTGRFADVTASHGPVTPSAQVAVDVDGDGDQDLLDGFGIALNQERQLSLLGPLSLGTSADLEFVVQRGFGQDTAIGLLAVNVRRLAVGVPMFGGRLFVDPNGAVLLAALTSVAGQAAQTALAIPANPALRGVDVHLQGAVIDAAQRLALLNHIRASIE